MAYAVSALVIQTVINGYQKQTLVEVIMLLLMSHRSATAEELSRDFNNYCDSTELCIFG